MIERSLITLQDVESISFTIEEFNRDLCNQLARLFARQPHNGREAANLFIQLGKAAGFDTVRCASQMKPVNERLVQAIVESSSTASGAPCKTLRV